MATLYTIGQRETLIPGYRGALLPTRRADINCLLFQLANTKSTLRRTVLRKESGPEFAL